MLENDGESIVFGIIDLLMLTGVIFLLGVVSCLVVYELSVKRH